MMQQPNPPAGAYGPKMTPMTRVELSVSASDLKDRDLVSTSDPVCILFAKESGQDQFHEIGRTEQIKNSLNPQWVKKFELDYRFEERQYLRINVYDWDTKSSSTSEQDSLGYIECSLAEIMAYQGSQFRKPLSNKFGHLVVCGEEVSSCKEVATMTFSGKDLDKKDFLGKSDPFLVFSRSTGSNSFTLVHKTKPIKKTLNPVWPPFAIPVKDLCAGDENRLIKIECYDWDSDGEHDLIGACETTLKTLKQGSGSQNVHTLINPKKKAKKSSYSGSGKLILNNISTHVEPSFLDYIRGGCQLHFTVAIDFTGSNGQPSNPSSLHFRQPGVDNQYSIAIKAVGEIIQDYDADKLFPALGFGLCIPPSTEVYHEYALNGRPDNPYCQGVEGILQAYQYALQTVQLYGPTNFSPVIRHVMQFARSFQDGNNYFVLLIITDGIITDLQETKKTLVEASSLPVSVIIVGVGSEDFSAMELLDADNGRLSANGVHAERDIVQFVEIRKYLSLDKTMAKEALAQAVLREVPNQFLAYMRSRSRPQ